MQEIYFKIRYFERRLSKALKKSTSFFLPNPVPFKVPSYRKQKKPGASDKLHFRLQNKFRIFFLLFMYYLTKSDDVL